MNTPDVIMSETSNGTKYAIAKSTDLNAIEKKYPKMMQQKTQNSQNSIVEISKVHFHFLYRMPWQCS